jgi:hypothetical protein
MIHVYKRLANLCLYAMLIFQLAGGMNWALAQPGSFGSRAAATASSGVPCVEHSAQHASDATPGSAHQAPSGKHDCCKSVGCQCQPGYTAYLLESPSTGVDLALTSVNHLSPAPVATERPRELFRPPIP